MQTMTMFLVAMVAMLAAACQDLHADPAKVAPAPAEAEAAVEAVADFYRMTYRPAIYDGTSKICADGYGRIVDGYSATTGIEGDDCMPYAPLPVVYFYRPDAWCSDGRFDVDGICLYGATSNDGAVIVVRLPPDGLTLGQDTAGIPGDANLAHELGHAASVQRGEGPDQAHAGHFFAPGGDVAQATAMLDSLGM